MAIELTVTAKGQVTLPQAVLDHLGVGPGGKVGGSLLPDGRVELASAIAGHDLRDVRGMLRRRQRPVSLRDMQDAIEAGRRRVSRSIPMGRRRYPLIRAIAALNAPCSTSLSLEYASSSAPAAFHCCACS